MRCPCGARDFATCCEPIIDGAPAPTAEALMRSRYSAYATRSEQHLARSWHPSTRPAGSLADPETTWLGLTIIEARGGKDDETGLVEFEARYRHGGADHVMHERSRFVRRAGRWVYLDGELT